jgi:GNAT superfamily N-acetyltransferase
MSENVYSIRAFLPEETGAYKTIRLEALLTEPGMFGSNYAREAAFTEEQWLARIINPDAACLGLYCNDELIGITGIMLDKEQQGTAQLTQSYIRKPFRGKGLSGILFETRLEWARERNLKRVEVGNRASNNAAIAANQRFGFRIIRRQPATWPDGGTEDILYYELIL